MKKCIILLFSFLLVLQGRAEEMKKLVICGDNAFPPYEFINEKGEPDGFNIELIKAVMDYMKQPYELRLGIFSDEVDLLENRRIDLITGVAELKKRKNHFRLSNEHNYISHKFVCRKDTPIHSAEELKDKRVIVQTNALPHIKLQSMGYTDFILVDNMREGLKMLSEGEGDVAICADNVAQYIIYKEGLTNLDIVSPVWLARKYCMAANDTRLLARINAAMAELKENGTYDQIHSKWFETKPAFLVPIWVYYLMCALLLTALLLALFVHFYKRRALKGEILFKKENEKLNALLLVNKNLLNRYRTVFNSTLVGLAFYDKDGILVDVNDRMLKLIGTSGSKEKLKEMNISIYQNPILRKYGIIDDQNQIHEYHGVLEYDMRKEHVAAFFARFNPLEKVSYLKMDITPIESSKGKLEGVLVSAIDHTAERNHEQRMAEEEAKLSLALDAGNIGVWSYDPATNKYHTLRGRSLTEEGISLEDNLKRLHPDDALLQRKLLKMLLAGEKDSVETTLRYIHKDGTYHYYESRIIVKKKEDKPIAILGTQKDVTKEMLGNKMLKETVEKLRFAIKTAKMAMWVYDCEKKIFTSYNDPIADYKDGALISMEAYDNSFKRDGTNWEQVKKATQIMRERKNESYYMQVKMKTKYDDDWQYCTIRGVPIELDENGKAVKYLGIRLNVTEQIKYQKILEREKAEAQQADKLKSAFLANMSHEIRTPLNAIVGFSDLLQTTDDRAERAEYMNIINRNSELLLRLIGDILDLSKIESGLIELKPETFDLSEVFKETYVSLKQRCTNSNVEFLGRNLYKKCVIRLDRNRLVQVYTNFVTNAIKHTEKGHILMGYEYLDGGVRIYVEDTGCGIPEEKQKLLFQRFAKLDDFTQGTGLGLAICKAIMDAQGGTIGLMSGEEHGCTFWAWFPCEAQLEDGDGTYEERQKPRIGQPVAGQGEMVVNGVRPSILVAEDIDSNYLLMKAILKDFHLSRAQTGKEAVELASCHHYDVILMDMKMPIMDGIEATKKIREFDSATPIIAVTANAFDSDRAQALEAGCNAFIAKPLKKQDLLDLLCEWT